MKFWIDENLAKFWRGTFNYNTRGFRNIMLYKEVARIKEEGA